MKKIISLILILSPFFLKAQSEVNFEITVIDSFTCFKIGQEGMVSLRAVNYNNDIHLAYIMIDTSSTANLMYAIRTNAGFTFDTVATLPNFHNYEPSTSLQFDSLGNPHIYCAYWTKSSNKSVYAYEKINNEWQGTFISNTGYYSWLVADPDGSKELGFAFWGPTTHFFRGQIVYAFNNNGTWEFKTLSDASDVPRNKPSIVNHGGKTFVAYGEGHYPDTLITRVYAKENGSWFLSYEGISRSQNVISSLDGLVTKLGASSDGVYLMHTLNQINSGNVPTCLKNSDAGWQVQNINSDAQLAGNNRNPNIVFDNGNTAFWMWQGNASSPKLSWMKNNGDGGVIDLVHRYHGLWLYDMAIKNNDIYIYYFEGSAGWPYGYPVTFKELKVNIDNIFTGIHSEIPITDNLLLKNYPNPFQRSTEISFHLPDNGKAVLNIFNADGKCVNKFLNKILSQGDYTFKFDAKELPAGMYYYKLSVDGKTSSNKMLLVK